MMRFPLCTDDWLERHANECFVPMGFLILVDGEF